MLFKALIPAGLVDFTLADIQCTTTLVREEACSKPFYDAKTGVLTALISYLPKDATITYTIPSKTVKYSSTWNTISEVTLSE